MDIWIFITIRGSNDVTASEAELTADDVGAIVVESVTANSSPFSIHPNLNIASIIRIDSAIEVQSDSNIRNDPICGEEEKEFNIKVCCKWAI